MHLIAAIFDFKDALIAWEGDVVIVQINGYHEKRIDNHDGRYKPCVTHARDLVRLVKGKPTERVQPREAESKPRPLRVHVGDDDAQET